MIFNSYPCLNTVPSFFSTVTPGQLPTFCRVPVMRLKMVVLPELGFPANAIVNRLWDMTTTLFRFRP
jgi:hypothetical protein